MSEYEAHVDGDAVLSALLVGDRELRAVPLPRRPIGATDVRVRVLSSGICGSDLGTYRGHHPYKHPPTVLGHELCGVVQEVGADVTTFKPGERVTSFAFASCTRCSACLRGDQNLCSRKENLSAGELGGSLAQEVLLRESMVCALPAGMPDDVAVLVEPLAIAAHAASLADLSNARVCVIGCGTIGLGSVIAACVSSARTITGLDRGERKRQRFEAVGGDVFVDVSSQPAVNHPKLTAAEHDVVIVATSYPGVLDDALRLVRAGGVVIVVSYFPDVHTFQVNEAVAREVTIRGSALSCRSDVDTVYSWWSQGRIDPSAIISHRFSLSAVTEAFQLMDRGSDDLGKIIVQGKVE